MGAFFCFAKKPGYPLQSFCPADRAKGYRFYPLRCSKTASLPFLSLEFLLCKNSKSIETAGLHADGVPAVFRLRGCCASHSNPQHRSQPASLPAASLPFLSLEFFLRKNSKSMETAGLRAGGVLPFFAFGVAALRTATPNIDHSRLPCRRHPCRF
jgi:hypothetical protein